MGAPGLCTSNAPPSGTTTEFDEGIDIDQTQLNGGALIGAGGINSINPQRLPRDPSNGCAPVFPWNFARTNTIFGVVHAAGSYTAWSDKHASYSSVSGPGDGTNIRCLLLDIRRKSTQKYKSAAARSRSFFAPHFRYEPSSSQSNERVTAFFQYPYNCSRRLSSIEGRHVRSTDQ
jgi:hypothetical protein